MTKLADLTLQTLINNNYNVKNTCRELGIEPRTLRGRLQKLGTNVVTLKHNYKVALEDEGVTRPNLPSGDIPIDKILDIMCERFDKRKELSDATKWMPFNVNTDKPIALVAIGDPHIDDNGCNMRQLRRDIDIMSKTKGMYAMNIGDTTNNWAGKLAKLYADQDSSEETAHRLIEWFFKDSGINWLIMIAGNHQLWANMPFVRELCKNICPMVDWRAQFKLVFKNGRECLIDAAHNFSGHSQWNNLHSAQKASVMGGNADIYVSGHTHEWGLAQHEEPTTGRVYHLVKARGYKHIDKYAEKLGYEPQQYGSSVVMVIDPKASGTGFVKCFADVKEGADYLNYLRNRNGFQK